MKPFSAIFSCPYVVLRMKFFSRRDFSIVACGPLATGTSSDSGQHDGTVSLRKSRRASFQFHHCIARPALAGVVRAKVGTWCCATVFHNVFTMGAGLVATTGHTLIAES